MDYCTGDTGNARKYRRVHARVFVMHVNVGSRCKNSSRLQVAVNLMCTLLGFDLHSIDARTAPACWCVQSAVSVLHPVLHLAPQQQKWTSRSQRMSGVHALDDGRVGLSPPSVAEIPSLSPKTKRKEKERAMEIEANPD